MAQRMRNVGFFKCHLRQLIVDEVLHHPQLGQPCPTTMFEDDGMVRGKFYVY